MDSAGGYGVPSLMQEVAELAGVVDSRTKLGHDYIVYFPTCAGIVFTIIFGLFAYVVSSSDPSILNRICMVLFPAMTVLGAVPLYFSPLWPTAFMYAFVAFFGYLGGISKKVEWIKLYLGCVLALCALNALNSKGLTFVEEYNETPMECEKYYSCSSFSGSEYKDCTSYCNKEALQFARLSYSLCKWLQYFGAICAWSYLHILKLQKEEDILEEKERAANRAREYQDFIAGPNRLSHYVPDGPFTHGRTDPIPGMVQGGPSRYSGPDQPAPSSIYSNYGVVSAGDHGLKKS